MVSFNDLQNDHAPDAWNITPSSDIILTLRWPVHKFYPVNHSAKLRVAAFAWTIILLHLPDRVRSGIRFFTHLSFSLCVPPKKITLTLSMISIMDAPIKPCRRHLLDVSTWLSHPQFHYPWDLVKKRNLFDRTMVNFSFCMVIQPPNKNCKVSNGAKIRNRYNQVPHLTQDTNGKVTSSQLDTTNKSNLWCMLTLTI